MSIRRLVILACILALGVPVGRGVAGPFPVVATDKINAAAPSRLAQIAAKPTDDAQAAQLAANIQAVVVAAQARLNLRNAPDQACDPNAQDAILRAISAPTPGVEPSIHLEAVKRASAALSQSGPQDPCTRGAFAQAIQLESRSVVAPEAAAPIAHPPEAGSPPPLPPPPAPVVAPPPAGPSAAPAAIIPPAAPAPAAASAVNGCKAGDGLPGLPACYNAPPTIPLYAETKFTLIIASNHIPSDAEFSGSPGPVLGRQVAVKAGSLVKAELTGPDDLVAIDSSRTYICQKVTTDDNSRWDWYVSPKTTAPIQLQVTLWEVASCDADEYKSHYVDSFTIPVSANFISLVKYYASPLNTTLLAILALITAAGGAFGAWKWLGGRKSGDAEDG